MNDFWVQVECFEGSHYIAVEFAVFALSTRNSKHRRVAAKPAGWSYIPNFKFLDQRTGWTEGEGWKGRGGKGKEGERMGREG